MRIVSKSTFQITTKLATAETPREWEWIKAGTHDYNLPVYEGPSDDRKANQVLVNQLIALQEAGTIILTDKVKLPLSDEQKERQAKVPAKEDAPKKAFPKSDKRSRRSRSD